MPQEGWRKLQSKTSSIFAAAWRCRAVCLPGTWQYVVPLRKSEMEAGDSVNAVETPLLWGKSSLLRSQRNKMNRFIL